MATLINGNKLWGSTDYPHIRIPKQMLCDPQYQLLSPEAIIVYAAMMDRTSLSYKHRDKFTSKKGEVYIYYPQHEIMTLLRCGHDKASKVLKELINANLIKVKRRGIGRPYEIVLIPIDWRVRKNKNERAEKPLQDSGETDHSLSGKTDRNNTDNKSEYNNPEYYIGNYLKYEVKYEDLIQNHDPIVIDRILNVAANTLAQETETIMIGNREFFAEEVKEKFRNLQKEHISYVVRKIRNATYTTEHSDTFILNALYESTTQTKE